MGKINVVRPDGSVVAVDEADYQASRGQTEAGVAESSGGFFARLDAEERKKKNSGVGAGVVAGVAAGLDTITLGGAGKLTAALSPELGQQIAAVQQDRPGAALAGSLAGLAVPVGGVGLAAKAAKVTEGATGSAALGRAAEGAIYGAGTHIARTNVSGDPLTIEGLAEDMTLGGALNVGFGLLADGVKKLGKAGKAVAAGSTPEERLAQAENGFAWSEGAKGETPLAKAARARGELDQAQLSAAKEVVDKSPAYADYRSKYDAANAMAAETNKAADAAEKAHAAFASPKGVEAATRKMESAQQQIRSRIQVATRGGAGWARDVANIEALQETGAQLSRARDAIRAATAAGDYEAVAGAFAAAKNLEERVPGLVLPDVPMPAGPRAVVGPALPDTLSELGSKRAQTIADIAGSDAHAAAADEFDGVANELGLSPAESPGETLASVHQHMREGFVLPTRGAVEEAQWKAAGAGVEADRAENGYSEMSGLAGEAASGGAKKSDSLLEKLINWTKRGAKMSAGRVADMGGWKGAFTRTMVGSGVGYSLDGLDGAIHGAELANTGAFVAGGTTLKAKLGAVISKYAAPAASVLERLGPVTDNMARRFPEGTPDPEKDPAVQAKNRILEAQMAAVAAPDAMFNMTRNLMGAPNDLALRLHQMWTNPLRFLTAVAPKDPGINSTIGGSDWLPSPQQADTFAHQWEAVTNPMAYLIRTMAGDGRDSGIAAMAANWPAMLQEARTQALNKDWTDATSEQLDGLSKLFQQPVTAAQHPDVVTTLQGYFLPRPSAGPSAGGKPGFGKSPRAVGRPAAVQSSVAGASVSNLIH